MSRPNKLRVYQTYYPAGDRDDDRFFVTDDINRILHPVLTTSYELRDVTRCLDDPSVRGHYYASVIPSGHFVRPENTGDSSNCSLFLASRIVAVTLITPEDFEDMKREYARKNAAYLERSAALLKEEFERMKNDVSGPATPISDQEDRENFRLLDEALKSRLRHEGLVAPTLDAVIKEELGW